MKPYPLPSEEPTTLSEVHRRYPALRQSALAHFDNCALSTQFDLLHRRGWSIHEAAVGIMFHRIAAECIRTMKRAGEQAIPVSEALEIMYEQLQQTGVESSDYVKLSHSDREDLRMLVKKWSFENEFSIDKVVDVERRLQASIEYRLPLDYPQELLGGFYAGEAVTRTITGQPDVLIAAPPDEAVVVDWKTGRGRPAEPDEGEEDPKRHLSYEGFYQQRFYAYLVMMNFPAINAVTLKEYYVRWGVSRKATITRDRLEHVERDLALDAFEMDRALASGIRSQFWAPSPGAHCSWCPKPGDCPIEDESRGAGAVTNQETANRYAAELQVAEAVRNHRRKALKAWAEPAEVKSAKGRRVWGPTTVVKRFQPSMQEITDAVHMGIDPETLIRTKTQQVWKLHTPDESDRGPDAVDLAASSSVNE